MRTFTRLLIFVLVVSGKGYAQDIQFKKQDYSKIGLTFIVPVTWEHDGLITTSKAAFIEQFGWIYDKPDAHDLWSAVGSFTSITVDSTRIPSDDAFAMHKMTIFVNRAHTLYRRWLCLQRKKSSLVRALTINDLGIVGIIFGLSRK